MLKRGLNSCLDKKERCLNFRQSNEVFKILLVRQSVFCRCRVNIDRKKLHYIVLCFVTSLRCCKNTVLSSATARQFRETIFKILHVWQYRISTVLSQSAISPSSTTSSQISKKLLNICSLTYTMQISTTARQTSNCMQIITYHVAHFRTNHFQNTPCPAVSNFLDFK